MSRNVDAIKSRGRHVYIEIGKLEIDPAVQKAMNKAWVKVHAADFDPDLFGEIVVSLRGGRHLIVDGQHRVEMRFNGHIDEAGLAQKLAKAKGGPSGMLGRAKSLKDQKRRSLGHCVAAGIVDVYNTGRRTGKLDDWWS